MPFSILGVFAHPDDEATVGPLLARYAREGHRVQVVAVTAGQRGVRPHNGFQAGDELGGARRLEMEAACRCLGIEPPVVLPFIDGEIAGRAVVDRVIDALRQMNADIVITFGPEGASGHSDHRILSAAVTEWIQTPCCPVRKLYYLAYPPVRRPEVVGDLLRRAMLARPVDPCFITTRVDCREDLDASDCAIRCHKTQWEPSLMEDWIRLNRQVLNGFVSLRLALSRVRVPAAEDDILSGLR